MKRICLFFCLSAILRFFLFPCVSMQAQRVWKVKEGPFVENDTTFLRKIFYKGPNPNDNYIHSLYIEKDRESAQYYSFLWSGYNADFEVPELLLSADIISRNDMWVISDEIHCDLLRRNEQHIPLGKVMKDYDRLITCMAPSKTFNLAGMMISNILIRDEGLKEIWLNRHYNFDNPISIAAAQAAYEKGEPWVEELRAYLDENFRYTEEYLKIPLHTNMFFQILGVVLSVLPKERACHAEKVFVGFHPLATEGSLSQRLMFFR